MLGHDGRPPVLAGSRVRLRPPRKEDAVPLYRCWSHPEVARWLGMSPPASPEEAEELVGLLLRMEEEQESLRWSIVLGEGEPIGSCGFNQWQLEGAFRAELGYELAPSYWGNGYMREALTLLLRYGFGEMGLNRIEALCLPGNQRAGRLMTSLGFRHEGTLREYRHSPAGFLDADLYALLRRERSDLLSIRREDL